MELTPGGMEMTLGGVELGLIALLLLFAASLLTVVVWLLQVTRERPPSPAARGLLTALCGFPSVQESWGRAWARALNREAARSRSSVQMLFEESAPLRPVVHVSHVTCADQSDNNMVFLCHLSADSIRFPVSVTQQSPAAVSLDTYQVSLTVHQALMEVRLQELPQEGLLVSWGFREPPDLTVHVTPRLSHMSDEGGAELCTLQDLIQDALLSAQPAMVFNLKASDGDAFLLPEAAPQRATFGATAQRINITPTKKVEMDRTVMPDGTIVTTVTTIQSRHRLDSKIESPSRSPSKVEVTENKPIDLSRGCSPGSSPSDSGGSPVSCRLDPVADTAIRQLTEPTTKPAKRTPTKRSTLIISGVSKVPIGQDEMALSLGYAASMDASLQGFPMWGQDPLLGSSSDALSSEVTPPLGPDTDDTTRSDISDRPSVEDLESETGSTGALETRSLKDHKVGFLRSGTNLLFRRRHRTAGLSQSHDNLTDAGPGKKRGSFPRRLIKRFSLKSKSKPGGRPPGGENPGPPAEG